MIRVNRRFVLVLIMFLLFAFAAGGTLPFYIFYAMLFVFILSCIYINFQKYFINCEVKTQNTVYKVGDAIECLVMVKCSAMLPTPYVIVKNMSYEESNSGYLGEMINLTREEDCWVRNKINFCHRGIYDLGAVDLKVIDIFNIFSLNKKIDCNLKVKVYPKIYKIHKMPAGGKDIYQESMDIRSNNEDIFTIKDVRKYNEGDSLKKVHWKVSAKHEELFVKNSDNISGEEFAIFLDMHKDNLLLDRQGKFEELMVDLCMSMVKFIQMKNISTKVFLNSSLNRCIEINSKENFDSLMEFFLSQCSDGNLELGEFIYKNFYKLQRNVRIGVITPNISSSLCNSLSRMKNYGYKITLFYLELNGEEKVDIQYLNNLEIECIRIDDMLKYSKDR